MPSGVNHNLLRIREHHRIEPCDCLSGVVLGFGFGNCGHDGGTKDHGNKNDSDENVVHDANSSKQIDCPEGG
jgi:hypothetical protein